MHINNFKKRKKLVRFKKNNPPKKGNKKKSGDMIPDLVVFDWLKIIRQHQNKRTEKGVKRK